MQILILNRQQKTLSWRTDQRMPKMKNNIIKGCENSKILKKVTSWKYLWRYMLILQLNLNSPPLSHWQKHIKSKKRNKFNKYHERTVRSILHLNQIKPKVGKALVTYAFNYIKSLTYITAYTVKTVQNLCQAPKECKRAVLIMTEKWFFKFVVCMFLF